jgi:predicted permease
VIRPGIRRVFHLGLFRRCALERDVDDEIALHMELRVAQLVARGVPPEQARDDAVRLFGPLNETRDELVRVATTTGQRMQWRDLLTTAAQDSAYAIRQLRRAPAFTASVIVTLALGIGANATMYGVIDRLLLRPPAHVVAPEQLGNLAVTFDPRGDNYTQTVLSYPIYQDLVREARAFEQVGAYATTSLTVGSGVTAQKVSGTRATASYFSALGVHPLIGRFFTPTETEMAPGEPVVVLGYDFWQRQFAASPDVLGANLEVAGVRYTVVGVAPQGFTGVTPGGIDVWIPLTAGTTARELENWKEGRQSYWLLVVVRPRAGITLARAAEAATTAIRNGEIADGETQERIRQRGPVASFTSALPRDARGGSANSKVAVLVGAVSLLLLVLAGATVANLQLTRAIRRRREIAIRLALGVSRKRLLVQLTLDTILLSLAGGGAALLVVYWGTNAVRRVMFNVDWLGGPVDAHVLAYTAVVALLTGLVSGLTPAVYASRPDHADALKAGARGGTAERSPTRTALLVVQAAFATVLLVGTGAFVLSVRRIDAMPLGMDPSHVSVVTVVTSGRQTSDRERVDLYQRLETAVRSFPGVSSAAAAISLPFSTSSGVSVHLPGRDSVPLTRDGGPYINAVGPDFFDVMSTRLLAGRLFNAGDRAGSAPVAIVNATTARLWWPGASAVGQCMRVGTDTMPCSQVVGVVENARRQTIIEGESVQFYVPMGQGPVWATPQVLFVRTNGSASDIASLMQRHVQQSVAGAPYVEVRPLGNLISPRTKSWRLGATMFTAFGILALLLASVGLYGILAYDVAQRTQEIGVRMALGASASEIAKLVVGRGVRTVGLGAAIGLMIVFAAGRAVAPLLFKTSPYEPSVLVVVAVTLLAAALLATWLPAGRASRVDPTAALRAD